MSGKLFTTGLVVGLATLLSGAAGCSNLNKPAFDASEAVVSPTAPPMVGNDQSPFRQRDERPLAGVLPASEPRPTDFGLETRHGDSVASTADVASGSDTFIVSDKMILPRTVVHVKQSNFDAEVLQSDVPVLVDFYADWCGPCKKLSPLLDQLAHQTEGARIVKVNIDDSPELAIRYGVKGIPHLQVFKGGKAVAQHVGMANKQQLSEMLAL